MESTLSTLGLLLLAWPAIAANAAAKRLSRIEQLSIHEDTDQFFRRTKEMLRKNANDGIGWKRHHEALLFSGYALSLAASLVGLFADW